jgi:hypothetical protein
LKAELKFDRERDTVSLSSKKFISKTIVKFHISCEKLQKLFTFLTKLIFFTNVKKQDQEGAGSKSLEFMMVGTAADMLSLIMLIQLPGSRLYFPPVQ